MKYTKGSIPANVFEGIEAVRLSGKTNMFDVSMVQRLAYEMEYFETVLWLADYPNLYQVGMAVGFIAEDGGASTCAD